MNIRETTIFFCLFDGSAFSRLERRFSKLYLESIFLFVKENKKKSGFCNTTLQIIELMKICTTHQKNKCLGEKPPKQFPNCSGGGKKKEKQTNKKQETTKKTKTKTNQTLNFISVSNLIHKCDFRSANGLTNLRVKFSNVDSEH